MADMLEQCERFEGDLAPLLAYPRRPPSRRALLTLALCDVAVEFWVAQRLLIRAGMHTAALALVRLHFEATVRAIWLHHGASDEWLERFAAPMAPGQLAEPVLGPNVDAMLQTLAKTAPPFLAQTLGAFKAATWQPMNSYVHGGIRPVVQSLAPPAASLRPRLVGAVTARRCQAGSSARTTSTSLWWRHDRAAGSSLVVDPRPT